MTHPSIHASNKQIAGGAVSPNAFAGITLDRSREVTEGQKSSDSWFFTTAAVAQKSAEALEYVACVCGACYTDLTAVSHGH